MSGRTYGYFTLLLFEGMVKLPLQFDTCYPGEDKLRATAPTKCGVRGRTMNKIMVLRKKDDIEQIIEWGEWETYLNRGTATKPILEPLDNFPGLADLIEQDKARSKDRHITCHGIFSMTEIKPLQYNGRHFYTYPQSASCKDSALFHNIYKLLALYLKLHNCFVLCTFFSKGEELGALHEVDGILCMTGLNADSDLKPAKSIQKYKVTKVTKGQQILAYEKYDKLRQDERPSFILTWRDYVRDSLEKKGVLKKKPKQSHILNSDETTDDLIDMFNSV